MGNNNEDWGIPDDVDNSSQETPSGDENSEMQNAPVPTNGQGNEPTQVSMSKKQVGIILIVVILILVFILYGVRGCSVSKKSEDSTVSQNTENVQNERSENTSENTMEDTSNQYENTTVSEEVSSASSEENSTTDNATSVPGVIIPAQEGTTEVAENEESSFNEVAEPVLSEPVTTTGIISGKMVYKLGSDYVYSVSLIVVTGSDKHIVCKYFCPRKSWDAIKVGDGVSVTLQMDTDSNVSITTMSLSGEN